MLKMITVAAILSVGTMPLADQVTSIETSRPAENVKDPNKPICERVEQIGTRLGARRVCMTATQWAEQRREQREAMERVQRSTNQAPSN